MVNSNDNGSGILEEIKQELFSHPPALNRSRPGMGEPGLERFNDRVANFAIIWL